MPNDFMYEPEMILIFCVAIVCLFIVGLFRVLGMDREWPSWVWTTAITVLSLISFIDLLILLFGYNLSHYGP
jgi:hypothetical protein